MKHLKYHIIAVMALFTVAISFTSCGNDDEPVITRTTLTYNTNGATSGTTPAAIMQETGMSITLNSGTGFSRDGYTFAGWNTNADGTGTNYAGGCSYTLNSNVTLFARWNTASSSNMTEHGRIEKFASLPSTPPANHSNPGTIQIGDLMLYSSSTLVLFYTTHNTSYSYTRIGRIDNPTGLAAALGTGSVTVTFELD